MEVQFQFRAATSVSLQPEKVKCHWSSSAGTAQLMVSGVEEVIRWWGHENFTKSHMGGEKRNFPWHRNRRKSQSGTLCTDRRSWTPAVQGAGDKSHVTYDDMGLGSRMHNLKFSILNHWQTPWKVWNSLKLKLQCGWVSPTPTTEFSCVPKTRQCHCRDCRSTFWFCSRWEKNTNIF